MVTFQKRLSARNAMVLDRGMVKLATCAAGPGRYQCIEKNRNRPTHIWGSTVILSYARLAHTGRGLPCVRAHLDRGMYPRRVRVCESCRL
jgi:hypothetical protein